MRRLRAQLRKHWEFLLSAGLFLTCIYAAVYFIVTGALAHAGYALFCAYGFFQACGGFAAALDLRPRREQSAETLEG